MWRRIRLAAPEVVFAASLVATPASAGDALPLDFTVRFPPEPDEQPDPRPDPHPRRVIGAILPPLTLSTRHDVWWTAPRATTAVGVMGGAGNAEREGATVRGRAIAQASVWVVSFDAMMHTRPLSDGERLGPSPVPPGSTLWLGLRLLVAESTDQSVSFGMYTRPGIGIGRDAQHRWDAGFALGGAHARWSWLVDLGARYRLVESTPATDALDIYLAPGGTFDIVDDVRLFMVTPVEGLIVGSSSEADLDGGVFVMVGAEIRRGPLLFMPGLSVGGVIQDAAVFEGQSIDDEPASSVELGAHLTVGFVPDRD